MQNAQVNATSNAIDFNTILAIQPKKASALQVASSEVNKILNDELTSISKAFNALRKATPKIAAYLALRSEKSEKFTFNADLCHQILNVGNLKALTATFDLNDSLRLKWSPNAIKTAFYKAIGVSNVKTTVDQLNQFSKNSDKNFKAILDGRLSQKGLESWTTRNLPTSLVESMVGILTNSITIAYVDGLKKAQLIDLCHTLVIEVKGKETANQLRTMILDKVK